MTADLTADLAEVLDDFFEKYGMEGHRTSDVVHNLSRILAARVAVREQAADREMVGIAGRLLTERDDTRDQHAALVARIRQALKHAEPVVITAGYSTYDLVAVDAIEAALTDADTTALAVREAEVRAEFREVALIRSNLMTYREDEQTSREFLIEGIDAALDALASYLEPRWDDAR